MEIAGKKVVDATKSLKITITPHDASAGKTKDPGACAAARAILRTFKPEGAKAARVHLGRTYIEYPDKWIRFRTPNSLKLEIVSFDRGTKPKYSEGTYNLERICASDRLRKRTERATNTTSAASQLTKSKRKKIARAIHQIEGVRARGANK
jgi:hypothetical protein